jgi:hypothetical protein
MKTTRQAFRHFLLIVTAIAGVNFVAPAPTGAVTCGLTDVNLDGFLEVDSQADLEEIKSNSSCLNASFVQTASFTVDSLSAVELGRTAPFTGRYNGGNHTITFDIIGGNREIGGLFYQTDGATISNLHLDADPSTSLYALSGWLVGLALNTTVAGVSSSGDITGDFSAGLISRADGTTTVTNSYTTGNITSNSNGQNTAGLIAHAYGNTSVANSYTTGNINGDGNYTAGLIALASDNTTVTNSYTTGNSNGSGNYTAGLIALASDNTTVTNSYTTGNINSNGEYTAGLIAQAWDNTSVANSYTTGNINGGDFSAGLIARASRNTAVTNSYTTGDVTGYGMYTAGLIALANESAAVTNSYTTGDVTGYGFNTAGLIALAFDNTTVTNAYTTGNINGSDFSAGLIATVQNTDTGNITVSNAYTTGDINGSDFSAGLIATVQNTDTGNITVSNAYTFGDITGDNSGGLIAEVVNFSNGSVTVSHVYTSGDINGDYSGGLISRAQNLDAGSLTVSNAYTAGVVKLNTSNGLIRAALNFGGGTFERNNEVHHPDGRWSTYVANAYLLGGPAEVPGRGSVWGACANDTPFFLVALNNGSCLPVIPVWRVTLDPNGGTCTDSTPRTEPWTTAFAGYRYLPGTSDCTKPGHTFTGWANTTTPTIPVDLPLLDDPSDGTKRPFIASNANLTAIWTKNPEPKAPTTFVALNGFFCRNCGNWLIWNTAANATSVTVTSGTRTVCTTLKITIDQWTLCHDPQPPRGPQTYTLTANNGTTTSPPITATTRR